ncbi:MAG: site-specific integrase [Daejeonella sp.]|uniref:tyrosine-type recombinase/integrase n=1 Tax=Daejeonella sp. TaxID=2805397 RepID=UPI0027363FD9|nr:site-specific integrase [Daejeonella sp.]MDP3470216.1 site-specific integrase [Daejeonella sp.]
MHTEIEIKGVEGRAFLLYYYEGIRQREYNGNKLSLPIYPNKAKTQADKVKLLKKLKFEFEKALDKGWNPLEAVALMDAPVTLEQSIQKIVDSKLTGNYSRTYTRDIEGTAKQFIEFLTEQEKSSSPDSLSTARITAFLDLYNSSNRNYMNKRQYLNVILPGTISRTAKKKYAEKLHEVYTKEQMLPILEFLKLHYPRLHLVALLAYGCFLRPHEESRLLKLRHIRDQMIYLSGEENKGKKVRVVHIPDYVYSELLPFIEACSTSESYILTGSAWLPNYDYLKTQWSRAKRTLKLDGKIKANQTLYSFRHTAAVKVYHKTKDIYILQQLLGHSDMAVTLKYLRGLGEMNNDKLKLVMPEL